MILIVDDNQENIFSLQRLLEINKFEVDTASSGQEALKKILQQNYSLIILDVQMPEMDGFEVAEAIGGYSKSKDIPIIFLSAINTHKKYITKGYGSGGIDYVTKPFDPDILLLKVKTFYRISEQTRQLNAMEASLREEIKFKEKAEVSLQQNVEELRSTLESIPQIAFTILPDGRIEFVNHHWFEYSKARNEFPKTEDTPLFDMVKRAMLIQKKSTEEIRLRKLNSEVYHYHIMSLTPVTKDGAIVKWVGMFTDIQEQKMASQLLEKRVEERTAELKKTNAQLEYSNNELKQFAYVTSHDLQEPLRKIQTFSSFVLQKLSDVDPSVRTYLGKITSSADRLRKLINDLLEYAHLSETNFYLTDLNQVAEEVLSDLEVKISSQQAKIHVGPMPEIEAIPTQMRQVFQNLIGNALKFLRDDNPAEIFIEAERVEKLEIESASLPTGSFCRITIRDNGIGFDERFHDKMFDIFQRLNRKDLYEGTGIGLAIVKKVIDQHHGIIRAKSKENEGASFILVLPIHQENSHVI